MLIGASRGKLLVVVQAQEREATLYPWIVIWTLVNTLCSPEAICPHTHLDPPWYTPDYNANTYYVAFNPTLNCIAHCHSIRSL